MRELKLYIFLALLFIASTVRAQDFIVIDDNTKNQTTPPVKSFKFTNAVVLGPGFSVNGATVPTGVWSCSPYQLVNSPQNLTQNFVRTEVILKEGVLTESQITPLTVDYKSTEYEYFDGVGRSIQKISVQNSPNKNDVISFAKFDDYGRQPIQYLPYTFNNTTQSGSYRSGDVVAEQKTFYLNTTGIANDAQPYSISAFDTSPLNRVNQAFGSGSVWHANDASTNPTGQNKFSKSTVQVNVLNEVYAWTYTGAALPQASTTAFYPINVLMVSETIDEENHIVRTYSNFKGQNILERKGDGTAWFDTYSVYDVAGNLMFVFPPEAVKRIFSTSPASEYIGKTATAQQAFLDLWCFQYKYDEYGRHTEKKVPGAGWVYSIYDKWDRSVLTQDAVQRTTNQWTFTKYDQFNRPILTGFVTGARATLQTAAMSAVNRFETRTNNAVGYTNVAFPTHVDADLLTINYFDDYGFLTNTGWDAEALSYSFVADAGFATSNFTTVKGKPTGTKIKVLDQTKWLNSVTYYDKRYRVIQTIVEHVLGGTDRVSSLFDFSGKELTSKRTHVSPLATASIVENYTYDHAHRLLTIKHQIDSGPNILMVSNKYNELGQLIEKNVHSVDGGATFLQSVDMRYNIRGWTTSINNSTLTNDGIVNNDATDLFGMELLYTSPSISINGGALTTKQFYDGNIAAIKWKTDTKAPSVTPVEKIYGFSYDQYNRFLGSYYATNNAGTWNGNAGFYDEKVSQYDANGNIGGATGALTRVGLANNTKSTIDNLSYRYVGNQLKNVIDNSTNAMGFTDKPGAVAIDEYRYDANGNLLEDMNKSITSMAYNYMDLPTAIEVTQSSGRIDRMEYTYDALGNKLSTVVKMGGTQVWRTDYAGVLQYDNSKVSFLSTAEGRAVKKSSANYTYEYFYKDHQNNVRLVYGLMNETLSFRATMENPAGSSIGTDEEAAFKNIAATRYQNAGVENYNYTPRSEQVLIPNKSARCNGYTGFSPVGPAKSLRVLTGDKVYMETYAKYSQVTGSSSAIAASALLAAFTTPFGIVNSGETVALFQSFNTNLAAVSSSMGAANTITPKGYLVFLFFNDSYQYIRSGGQAITTSAYNAFEKLSKSFTAEQNGYLYIYVANESNGNALAHVYFDETYIVHEKNNAALQVVQASDYYPFGLSFNQYNADRLQETTTGNYAPELRNRYLFQGQEQQKDLDLGWYQYKYRMHDPSIGRFGGTDPLAEKYMYNSPYAFSENRLINGVELEGLEYALPRANRYEYSYYGFPQAQAGVFFANAGFSFYNGLAGIWNYADKLDQASYARGNNNPIFDSNAYKTIGADATKIGTAIKNYAQITTPTKFGSDLKNAFSQVETYENLTSFALPFAFSKIANVGKLGTTANTLGKIESATNSLASNSNIFSRYGFQSLNHIDDVKGVSGLYIFEDATRGMLPYVGKSNYSIAYRLNSHKSFGRIGGQVYFKPLSGTPTFLEVQETIIMNNLGGKLGTANRVFPVSPARNIELGLGITNY